MTNFGLRPLLPPCIGVAIMYCACATERLHDAVDDGASTGVGNTGGDGSANTASDLSTSSGGADASSEWSVEGADSQAEGGETAGDTGVLPADCDSLAMSSETVVLEWK